MAQGLLKETFDVFMIFGGVFGYIFQYRDIYKSKDSSGFSSLTCLVLLLCNSLRIIFWFGKRFDNALLYQSIVMVIAQLMLLELCVRMKKKGQKRSGLIANFWNWDHYSAYVLFLLVVFTIAFSLAHRVNKKALWEGIGDMALGIEAMLGLPQLKSNYERKSTEGCSLTLIMTWFLGDVIKSIFFWVNKSPYQFVVCGYFQLFVDILILCQVYMYRKREVKTK